MALGIGDVIDDKYEITGVLGEGGMGTVFVGHHRRIHRQVAIKVLKASIAADETMVRRFEREAQAAGRIGSKHIVEVVDVGQIAGGERYMVLEHLRGETLLARLRRVRTMDPPESFPLAIQLLKGLAAAHAAGIIHRDLKPSNIFLVPLQDDGGDFVKIIDFGVSKFHCLDAEGMTQTGTMVGTPHYMAPEQTKEAAAVDHRSDLYAVGALLYRALAGRTPFRVTTIHELIAKLISEDPPALSTVVAGIDPAAAAIVHRALARTPEDRFADAEQFMDALRGWLTDGGVSFTSGRFSNVGLSWPGTSAPLPAGGPAPSAPAGEMSSAGEPATLATPSPAFYDTTAQYGPKRSTVGLALAGGAVVLVGSVMAIVSLVGGDETTAPGETTASAATGPGGETTVSKRIDQEPQATASASASTSASAATAVSARKAEPPPTRTARKPAPRRPVRPHKPPPKPSDDRDFRTDL